MLENIDCEACGIDWQIKRTKVHWRTQEMIDCPKCEASLLREQGHEVISLKPITTEAY